MTNSEIILHEMQLHNVSLETKVDTFAGWKRKGKSVKKGEKAIFTTAIWKPSNKKVTEQEDETVEENKNSRMYLVKAAFFTESQVEDTKEEK